jgi:hypothetical protein
MIIVIFVKFKGFVDENFEHKCALKCVVAQTLTNNGQSAFEYLHRFAMGHMVTHL